MLKMLMRLRGIELDETENGIQMPPSPAKADDEKESSTKRVKQESVKEGLAVILGVRSVEADSNKRRDSNGDETRVGVMANLSDVGRGKTPGRESVNSISPMDSAQCPSNSASPRSSSPPQTMSDFSPASSQYQASLPSPLPMTATMPSPLSQEIYSLRQFTIPTSKGDFAPTDFGMADFSTGVSAHDMAGLYATSFRNDPTNPFWGMPTSFDWNEWSSYVQDHGQQMQFEMETAQTEIVANQAPLQMDHVPQHPRAQQPVRGISE